MSLPGGFITGRHNSVTPAVVYPTRSEHTVLPERGQAVSSQHLTDSEVVVTVADEWR